MPPREAELDRALQVLNGVTGEHTATQVYLENLMEQQARQEAQRQAHEVAVAKAVDARLEAKVQGRKAEEKLEALRAALEDAEAKLAAAEAALQRRREAEEKRGKKLDKEAQAAEDLRNAQMQIELDLATRPPARPPCWLYEPPLSEAARRVFVEFAQRTWRRCPSTPRCRSRSSQRSSTLPSSCASTWPATWAPMKTHGGARNARWRWAAL